MTSYTDATETASTGEGKRNRKTHALSALLSATALGVFLEGCSGGDGGGAGASPTPNPDPTPTPTPPTPPPDPDPDLNLYFPNANGFNDFSFARTGDNNEDVEITVGDESNTIMGFANNVYTLYYGSLGTGTELGKLYVGTEIGGELQGNDDVANVMIGLGGNDELYGGGGNDFIYGGAGVDILGGGAGDDILDGGEGADTLDGGAGLDTASYANARNGVRVDLALSGLQVDFDGTHGFASNENEAVGDKLVSIEHITGSNHDDWLTGDSNDNTLRGGAGNDRMEGGAGNDILYGGEGADTLDGGAGLLDTASYANSSKGVLVSLALSGAQVDFGGVGHPPANSNEAVGDVLIDIENLVGSDLTDFLTGDENANRLDGGAGDDILRGEAGNDYLYGGEGGDTLYGGTGTDFLQGDAGTDFLQGNAGEDILDGGAGVDVLYGGAGTDTYVFRVGDGTDTLQDIAGDTMTLRFEGGDYAETDFASAVFSRDGNDLEITLDKLANDGITDKITIKNAYDADPDTGLQGSELAFTINIEYGIEGSYEQLDMAALWAAWSALT